VNELKNYINELPNTDEPEIFGMHQNAHIVYLKNESLKILNHVLNIQPRVNQNKEGVSSDTQVLELCKTIVGQIPELIDSEAFHKDILKTNPQGLLHCFSTVLMQELYRYNLLLS
jgi:dynein heavy chain